MDDLVQHYVPHKEARANPKVYVEEDTKIHLLSSLDHNIHENIGNSGSKYIMLSGEMLPAHGDETMNLTVSAVTSIKHSS